MMSLHHSINCSNIGVIHSPLSFEAAPLMRSTGILSIDGVCVLELDWSGRAIATHLSLLSIDNTPA
jgi:hypothetical protein